jgi:CubicO group peptidase (beta-lactamase class C family)
MSHLSRRSFLRLTAHLTVGGALGGLLVSSPARASAAAPPLSARSLARVSQDRIDGYIQERMSAWGVPGLALAIVEDGQVSVTRGYGLADREQAHPMTPRTPVAIGSTTKPITTAAVLQLVEAGAVELDVPVSRYLPWFTLDDPRAASITVRQVLSHTSGIPASASLDGRQEPDALERRVRVLEWAKLQTAPGERFEYSNPMMASTRPA